jgi:protein-disulfide isomerase
MPSVSTRSALKAQRKKRQQQARRNAILAVAVGALILVAAIATPAILQANQPVGDITPVVPITRSNAQGTSMGDPNAPVKIDVFEDFQCPACVYYTQQTEAQVELAYVNTGKVYYVFHNFPFIDDNNAFKASDQAANASMCAAEQNLFWEYHDMVYANWLGENDGTLTDRRLIAFAETVDLDMSSFKTCFAKNPYKSQIQDDINLGKQMGVQGTPSVFVNGTLLTPGKVPTFENVQSAVEAILAE